MATLNEIYDAIAAQLAAWTAWTANPRAVIGEISGYSEGSTLDSITISLTRPLSPVVVGDTLRVGEATVIITAVTQTDETLAVDVPPGLPSDGMVTLFRASQPRIAGGTFHRARDPFEVLELLGNGPGFRVILLWQGDEFAGSGQRSNVVKTRFVVTVSANRGLPIQSGAGLTMPRHDGAQSLMDHVADIQALLLHHVDCGENTSSPLKYERSEPVTFDGALLDAYEIQFSLFHALPDAEGRTRINDFLSTL